MNNPEVRTFDGSNNNIRRPEWGKAGTPLLRKTKVAYKDGKSTLATRGKKNPNPRAISNEICRQTQAKPSGDRLSDFVWAWGQFLDHELDLTESTGAQADIAVPKGDAALPGGGTIEFKRSIADPRTGTSRRNPLQQINQISAYIDATNVYGFNPTRAAALRIFDGTGRLKVTPGPDGDLLPYNLAGFPNAPSHNNDFFLAGDVRANEHSVLTSMHTLFVREHNRLCAEIRAFTPLAAQTDESIYQAARRIIGAQMQVITYEEFIPALLGLKALKPYRGYRKGVNASIANIFSTACYRLGHSMVSGDIRLGQTGRSIALRDAFFNPRVVEYLGVEPFLGGLSGQVMQEVDAEVVEDLRSFLFGPPRDGKLLDLPALNIQRGRDHGLPDYNQCRADYGLAKVRGFAGITRNVGLQRSLKKVYGDVNSIDPWVGGLAEDHKAGANVGEFIFAVLRDQFERLRDGDRFWYECDPAFTDADIAALKATRLSDIIRRNTNISDVPDDVFKMA